MEPSEVARRQNKRDVRALTGLYEISKILSSSLNMEAACRDVLRILFWFLEFRFGAVILRQDLGDYRVAAGICSEGRTNLEPPREVLDAVVAHGMPLVIADILNDPLFDGLVPSGTAGQVALVAAPIRGNGAVLGVLAAERETHGAARLDEDTRFLSMVANLVGQSVVLHQKVAEDRERLLAEQWRLQKELEEQSRRPLPLSSSPTLNGIIGSAPAIRAVMDRLPPIAASSAPVLLRGESGTGKEIFARAIHELSPRAKASFIRVNCAALSETLLESELFGHEKGAFTGALERRKGRFELADGGTLFLDEIGEISPAFQAKLLRVLQEGELERVGGSQTIRVNTRIIAATNRDLESDVRSGRFRADLYYRIAVVPVLLPPLRERRSDIPALAQAFLKRFNADNGRNLSFAPAALSVLQGCYFPGNVRELENCVKRAATLARGSVITAPELTCQHESCLSAQLLPSREMKAAPAQGFTPLADVKLAPPRPRPASPPPPPPAPAPHAGHGSLTDESEKERLIQAMETAGWVQAKAARILGLTPRQIGYALRKHGIEVQRF
ncbi:nif-specific transcriptional activator NifA [Rhodospirillum centenum]|uniref:Nif-specific regulatory protein n=1 Tax=Rhodospirillum centenum (strain ATCC 51521 / SW) TaxID=414684 RepID=B6IXL6_RHOCS|nr:nif-specific transcriptional activator NifA [Rhodospirillum centenum]ACJ01040.1 Mo/Fe nitrogenase specific transcriptional regulator (Fis family) [Rhodospirillum centenum SW]